MARSPAGSPMCPLRPTSTRTGEPSFASRASSSTGPQSLGSVTKGLVTTRRSDVVMDVESEDDGELSSDDDLPAVADSAPRLLSSVSAGGSSPRPAALSLSEVAGCLTKMAQLRDEDSLQREDKPKPIEVPLKKLSLFGFEGSMRQTSFVADQHELKASFQYNKDKQLKISFRKRPTPGQAARSSRRGKSTTPTVVL